MDFLGILSTCGPKLLAGLGMTLKLTFMGALIAAVLAPVLALVRANAGTMAQFPLRVYVSFMRGTPLLAQMFLIY